MRQYQCPWCNGYGGEVEPVLDDGTGPWYICGYCDGKGTMSRNKFYIALGYFSAFKRSLKKGKWCPAK